MRIKKLLGIIILFMIMILPLASASGNSSVLLTVEDIDINLIEIPNYPLMNITPSQAETKHEFQMNSENAFSYLASLSQTTEYQPIGRVDLLQYYSYNPSKRNQGVCGNCWVWAGTGSISIQHGIKNGINDDLSVQLFNSYYNNGGGNEIKSACCGGLMPTFADAYKEIGYVIPLTNDGAEYFDGNTECDTCSPGPYCQTKQPIDSIDKSISYPIESINYGVIDSSESNEKSILNIKRMLDAGYPVDFGVYFTKEEIDAFSLFWAHYPDNYLFQWGGTEGERPIKGGHEMLIVGYEDNAELPYWTVLNSWGTAGGNRTLGTFRMPQNIDYVNSYITIGGKKYPQFDFDVIDINYKTDIPVPIPKPDPSIPLIADFSINQSSGTIPLFVAFSDKSSGTPSSWHWSFGDGFISKIKNPSHVYMIPGKYSVTLTAFRGEESSISEKADLIHVKPPYQPVKAFPNKDGGDYPDPTDPDNDGLFEDINGNGWLEYEDPKLLFDQMLFAMKEEPIGQFDFDKSGFIGFGDVVKLYQMV